MDQTKIPQALDSMLDILVYEELTDEAQGLSGPCVEYLLRSDIVDTLYSLARADVSTFFVMTLWTHCTRWLALT